MKIVHVLYKYSCCLLEQENLVRIYWRFALFIPSVCDCRDIVSVQENVTSRVYVQNMFANGGQDNVFEVLR